MAADLDALSRAALLTLVRAHARLQPMVASLSDGVEIQWRGDILFLPSHFDRVAEVAGVAGTDLLSGRLYTGHMIVPPRSALVVHENTWWVLLQGRGTSCR